MILLEMKLGPEVILIPALILFFLALSSSHLLFRLYKGKMGLIESALGMMITAFFALFVSYLCWPSPYHAEQMSILEGFIIFKFALLSIVYAILFYKASSFK